MHLTQGRKRPVFTRIQLGMMAIGFGYVIAGCCLGPAELRHKALVWVWNLLASCEPW